MIASVKDGAPDMTETVPPLDRKERDLSLAEKRVDAMLALLARADPECAGMHRSLQQDLRDVNYDAEPYYDYWLRALRRKLVRAGLLDEAEVERRLREVRARRDQENRP